MTYLSTGTVTVERDGEEYKVTVDAVDEYDAPFKADFAGQIYYENTSEQASISPREVYVVCYGEKDGLTNWYITLVDRGYLTTRDAVGNCYYGSILHFDLRSDAANDYADGVPKARSPYGTDSRAWASGAATTPHVPRSSPNISAARPRSAS